MKPLTKIRYSLGLFILLSLFAHLCVWGGLSGAGIALLAGFGGIAPEEVVNVIIANPPPEPSSASLPIQGKGGGTAAAAPAPVAAPVAPAPRPEEAGVTQTDSLPAAGRRFGRAAVRHAVTAAGPAFENVSATAASSPLPASPIVASAASPAPLFPTAPISLPASVTPRAPASTVAASKPAPASPDIVPCARERLAFSLYWSGFYVGTAVIEAVKGNGTASITSTVRSNAVISAFYEVKDRAEARLVNGLPASFTMLQHEGSHRRNRETIFDREHGKVIYIDNIDKTRKEFAMGGKVLWDVISAFYYLRRQPLEIGKPVYISMFDSEKFLNTEVRILRRDRVEQGDGREVPSIVVEPVLTTEGLFKKEGEILIWLTDDERRLPVRMETKLKIGRVTAELKSYTVSE